jgi:hypothetical protein
LRDALVGSEFCQSHDPAWAGKIHIAKPPEVFDGDVNVPKTPEETKNLILKTMADAAAGKIDHNRAKAISELGRVAIKFFKDYSEEDPAKGFGDMSEAELVELAAKLLPFPAGGSK